MLGEVRGPGGCLAVTGGKGEVRGKEGVRGGCREDIFSVAHLLILIWKQEFIITNNNQSRSNIFFYSLS